MDITLPQDEKKVLLFYNTHTNHIYKLYGDFSKVSI
jgi:hypothetical protein